MSVVSALKACKQSWYAGLSIRGSFFFTAVRVSADLRAEGSNTQAFVGKGDSLQQPSYGLRNSDYSVMKKYRGGHKN